MIMAAEQFPDAVAMIQLIRTHRFGGLVSNPFTVCFEAYARTQQSCYLVISK